MDRKQNRNLSWLDWNTTSADRSSISPPPLVQIKEAIHRIQLPPQGSHTQNSSNQHLDLAVWSICSSTAEHVPTRAAAMDGADQALLLPSDADPIHENKRQIKMAEANQIRSNKGRASLLEQDILRWLKQIRSDQIRPDARGRVHVKQDEHEHAGSGLAP
jgi:hypothetical protein